MRLSAATGSLTEPSIATMAGGISTTSSMMRRVWAKITGPGCTLWRTASVALSTGPIGTDESTAVITSTRAMRIRNAATTKPSPMVRKAVPTIGSKSDTIAPTASGVKDSPTEVATRICPICRV